MVNSLESFSQIMTVEDSASIPAGSQIIVKKDTTINKPDSSLPVCNYRLDPEILDDNRAIIHFREIVSAADSSIVQPDSFLVEMAQLTAEDDSTEAQYIPAKIISGDNKMVRLEGLLTGNNYLVRLRVMIKGKLSHPGPIVKIAPEFPSPNIEFICPIQIGKAVLIWNFPGFSPEEFKINIWNQSDNISSVIKCPGIERYAIIDDLFPGDTYRIYIQGFSKYNQSDSSKPLIYTFPDEMFEEWAIVTTNDNVYHEMKNDSVDNISDCNAQFLIYQTEVSNAQYLAFCQATGRCFPKEPHFYGRESSIEILLDYPVVNVNWDDAVDYCNWRSIELNTKPYYRTDYPELGNPRGIRLPYCREWELAADCEKGCRYAWGNDHPLKDGSYHCNLRSKPKEADGYSFTSPVKAFGQYVTTNEIYNLNGNVWEWCQNIFEPEESNSDTLLTFIMWKNKSFYRVLKGGCWNSPFSAVDNYIIGFARQEERYSTVGFRPVLPLKYLDSETAKWADINK